MKRNSLVTLLATLTSQQVESGLTPLPSDDAIRSSLLGQQALSEPEIDAIWASPEAQDAYLRVRRGVIEEARNAWHERGYSDRTVLRAAASATKIQTVRGQGWTLEFTEVEAGRWVVSLDVSATACAAMPAAAQIRVADDGGLIWAQGTLSGKGNFDFEWPHGDSPAERLRSFGVSVAPV